MKVEYNKYGQIEFRHTYGVAYAKVIPGTGEAVHINDFYVNFDKRGQGLGSQYHQERLDWLENAPEYTLATCIVNDTNIAEKKILEKNNWKFLHKFKSKEGEDLWLCARDLIPTVYSPDQAGDQMDDI